MIQKPDWFDLDELVCPHVYYKFGEMAWQFFDPRLFVLMDWVRHKLGPVFINNWYHNHRNTDYFKYISSKAKANIPIMRADVPDPPRDLFDERGLRCNLCDLNLQKTNKGIIYVSPHFLGKAIDFDVMGRTSEEVRQWLVNNKGAIPYPIRLEKNVNWVHMDCEDSGEKVQLINP